MSQEIVTRFAPSPTGYLHVGGARTALYNWLYARRHGGRFILRIEDTDVERSTAESVEQILEAMRWLGLDWDGEPVYQSRRLEAHRAEARRLLESGHAYRCFCTNERLDELREAAKRQKKPFVYDRLCHGLDPAEAHGRAEAGEEHVLRFHVPDEGIAVVEDLIRGTVKVDRNLLGDFILMRPGDRPTYNFANVVDDHEMGITHVIRGEDHLPNTPRQLLLYEALGYDKPAFAHLSMILGDDRQRLSKRHGAVSVLHYRDEGYQPEAMLNFLALLGWSVDDKTEKLSRSEMVELFSLERVNKAGAIFNVEKLRWLNGVYFRELGGEECIRRARAYMAEHGPDPEGFDRDWLDKVIGLEVERARNLSLLVEHLGYFLSDEFEFEDKAVNKHLKKEGVAERLTALIEALGGAPDLGPETLEPLMRGLAESQGCSFSKIVHPCRVALTGVAASPGIFEVIECLGRERVLKRLAHARDHLCG